ncbi:hypothetical protein IAU59_003859 [Kwoniella sp. CBS 9459]
MTKKTHSSHSATDADSIAPDDSVTDVPSDDSTAGRRNTTRSDYAQDAEVFESDAASEVSVVEKVASEMGMSLVPVPSGRGGTLSTRFGQTASARSHNSSADNVVAGSAIQSSVAAGKQPVGSPSLSRTASAPPTASSQVETGIPTSVTGTYRLARRPADTSTAPATAITGTDDASGKFNSPSPPAARRRNHSWEKCESEALAKQVNGHMRDPDQEPSRDEMLYRGQKARDAGIQVNGDISGRNAIDALIASMSGNE